MGGGGVAVPDSDESSIGLLGAFLGTEWVAGDSWVVLELGSESRQHCKVCSLVSISRGGN